MSVRRLSVFVTLSVLLAACGEGKALDDGIEADELEPSISSGSVQQGIVSCAGRTDTGYSNGRAFTIEVVDADGKPAERGTADAYAVMQEAAARDGVHLVVVSGFRTMAEQQHLYSCYRNCSCNSCSLAAAPGYSNHQSGHALDLNTSDGGVYGWLTAHAAAFGFRRTVPSELWHWEWWGGGPGGGPCARGAVSSAPAPVGNLRVGIAPRLDSPGYWVVAQDGAIYSLGESHYAGGGNTVGMAHAAVALAPTPSGNGYWIAGDDGGVFSFGDAGFFGSAGGIHLNKPIVGMAATPSGQGYWLVASDGGIFAFGDAGFFGSTGAMKLNSPVVGMAATPSGRGYWLVASDGGIFAFGDAGFFGSTGAMKLNKPIVGMAATPSGAGYWLVAADGGIFAFGDAGFFGSTGSLTLSKPISGMARTPSGKGYWLLGADGGVFSFGDAAYLGNAL